MSGGTASFFYDSDSSLDFRYVLICAVQVDSRSARQHLNQTFKGSKFSIRAYRCNTEATLHVVDVYFLKGLEHVWYFTICQMIHSRE